MPDHAPHDQDVIATELAACILGHRQRTELRIDSIGQLARLSIAWRIQCADLTDLLLPVMRRATEVVRAALAHVHRLTITYDGLSDTPTTQIGKTGKHLSD